MTFDDITEDGRLWAVRYDEEKDNALYTLFDQWSDVIWLRSFFKANWQDLTSYFKITGVNQAVEKTIEDSDKLQGIIMDISPNANLIQTKMMYQNYLCPRIRRGDTRLTPFAGRQIVSVQLPTG